MTAERIFHIANADRPTRLGNAPGVKGVELAIGCRYDDLLPAVAILTQCVFIPICSADWWVSQRDELKESVQLDIVTPARLLAKGKPLFRPDVNELVPYLLRRVTSMCYAHAGVMLLGRIDKGLDEITALGQAVRDVQNRSVTLAL